MIVCDIEDRLLEASREIFEGRKLEEARGHILIEPFNTDNIDACTYDLTVGAQYLSLRNIDQVRELSQNQRFSVEPGETVLIITEEYLALPDDITAVVVPKAGMIFEGSTLNATRIDPTWYGKLLIGLTNIGKDTFLLQRGEHFCACIFLQTTRLKNPLTTKETPLGRKAIERFDLKHIRPQKLKDAKQVKIEDLDEVVTTFGRPWDIMRGVTELTREELTQFISRDIAPNVARDATQAAISIAFKNQMRTNNILVGAFVTAVITGVVSLILILLKFVFRIF